jgi:hypothetical protein
MLSIQCSDPNPTWGATRNRRFNSVLYGGRKMAGYAPVTRHAFAFAFPFGTFTPFPRSQRQSDAHATGLVATPSGVPPSLQTVSGVTVTIGTVVVPADFAGLVAVGEFQINEASLQPKASLSPLPDPSSYNRG